MKRTSEFLWEWLRRWLARGCWAYIACLVTLVGVIFPFIGERNALVALFLYMPRIIFFLPLLGLIPMLWAMKGWRQGLTGGIIAIAIFPSAMGMRFGQASDAGSTGALLRLASYNRGQHGNQSFQPFLKTVQPDVVLMQDAARRGKGYREAEAYAHFPHIEDLGEFLILSRFPILERELIVPTSALPGATRKRARKRRALSHTGPAPMAARFVVQLPGGKRISLYNVHTMTVRERLRRYLRGRGLLGILGVPGGPWSAAHREESAYWEARWAQLEELAAKVAADPHPCVIAGDFNVPVGGWIYRQLCATWKEAHREVGTGCGYSFPGKTRNPLSLRGPWMRLDHVFVDADWLPRSSVTERKRKSQHLGVFAALELKP